MKRKVLIVGAGAMGGMLGAYLTNAGHKVTAVDDWLEHVGEISHQGLAVRGTRGEFRARFPALGWSAAARAELEPDVILICVKSYDTDRALTLIERWISETTTVVSIQNGLNEERIASAIGVAHVVGAAVEIGGFIDGPGQIVETRADGGFVIGELDGHESQRCASLARLMEDCAPTLTSRNITGVLWSKLIWNCMLNSFSAITGMGQGELLLDGDVRELMFAVAREGGAVAASEGIKLEPLVFLGVDPSALTSEDANVRAKAEEEIVRRYSSQLNKTTSMAQDIARGRRTEIEYLNGYVVGKATENGGAAPLNSQLVALVRALEAQRVPQGRDLLANLLGDARLANRLK